MRIRNILNLLVITAILASFGFAQDEPDKEKKENVLGEVEVNAKNANSDPIYKEIRNLSGDSNAFSGPYAKVNNLVLKKDEGVFTFRSGEIYFLKEAQGKRTLIPMLDGCELKLQPGVTLDSEFKTIYENGYKASDLAGLGDDWSLISDSEAQALRDGAAGSQPK